MRLCQHVSTSFRVLQREQTMTVPLAAFSASNLPQLEQRNSLFTVQPHKFFSSQAYPLGLLCVGLSKLVCGP